MNICLGIYRQTCVTTFNAPCLYRLHSTKGPIVLNLLTISDMNMTYASDDERDEFLLMDSNSRLKYANRRRR